MLDEKHVGDGLNSVSETQALSHSGCGCCGNIFAEGVGRHGNNRNSGCVPGDPGALRIAAVA